MNPLSLLRNLLLALAGGVEPRHLAAGFALGAALGLVPKGNLIAASFFLLFFFLRVDKGMAFVTAAVFTPLAYAIDGPAHRLGLALLQAPALKGLWTFLYDLPIVPLTRFNNSVVLGNLVIAVVLFAPLYLLGLRLAGWYNAVAKPYIERSAVMRSLKSWYWFQKYQEFMG
ncbi:MAG: TIGR03546 family protein [Elusimicrobiota bacterium]|nr:TIGR03546 family protein [Elusimicrobiota bacterium]